MVIFDNQILILKRKILLGLILVGICQFLNGQNKFIKGQIVQESGEVLQCFIKTQNSKTNPKYIEYKLNNEAEVSLLSINGVSSYTLEEGIKYTKHSIQVDISSNKLSDLNYNREPILEVKTLFLKSVIEGKVSLLEGNFNGKTLYFIVKEDGEVEQLIYKKYFIKNGRTTTYNTKYKQQLNNALSSCSSLELNDFKKTKYAIGSLHSILKKYNECEGITFKDSYGGDKKADFKLKLKVGINSTNIEAPNLAVDIDFDNQLGIRGALEAEIIFPLKRNSLGFFAEVAKHSNIQESFSVPSPSQDFMLNGLLNVSTLDTSVGGRYYIDIGNNFKISFYSGFTLTFISEDSGIDFELSESADDNFRSTASSLFFGAGFQYGKIGIEGRVNLRSRLSVTPSDSQNLNAILFYELF